jgi:uncharacterized protein YhfF
VSTPIPPAIRPFWQAFAATCPVDPTPRFLEAFHFVDSEAGANELAALVVAGVKRATAGLLWSKEHDGETLPPLGSLSVVTDWHGRPQCVIETRQVDIVPFDAVSAEFAAVEGEGDGSLAFWRQAHQAYFERECRRIGRTPTPQMLVVCERFEVVYVSRP